MHPKYIILQRTSLHGSVSLYVVGLVVYHCKNMVKII